MVAIMENNLLVEPEEVCYNGGQLKARNYLHFCDKYEQTVNTPKITFKKAFFRIFWKILAKTGPQSLYLCGFPEASVEMKVAPFRALTQTVSLHDSVQINCGNEGRPFQGIDT